MSRRNMKDYNFNQVFLNIIDSGASKQLVSFLHLNNISANISEKSLSILLAKASFAFLLISMLSYWFQMSFKSQRLMNSFRKNSERIPQKLVQPERNSERVVSTNSEEIPKELCQRVVSTNSQLRVRRKPLIPSSVAELRIPAQRLPLWGTRGKKQSFAKDKESGVVLTSCANELILSKGVTPCKASLCNPLQGVRSKGYIEDLQEADHKSQAITYTKTDRKNLYYFLEKVPFVSMWSANITLALLLSIRWIESGHFPLSNLYESLIFLSWSLTVIHLFLENFFNKREQREPSTLKILGSQAEYSIPLQGKGVRVAQLNFKYPEGVRSKTPTLTLGAITSPVALFTNAFATFSLPQEMQKVTVLVPALKSNWLIMHVSVMIISYAALLSGSLLAMAFLVIKFIDDNKVPSIMFTFINPLPLQGLQSEALQSFGSIPLNRERSKVLGIPGYQESETKGSKPLLLEQRGSLIKENKGLLPQILDNLSYRSISLGFALLTIGILSGAVWANEAWGSYWSWDPKETWALITWLIFALYLHTRLSKGWVGKESAFVASFGFIVIWFCYLGVNLFGKGLHSYGWFQQ